MDKKSVGVSSMWCGNQSETNQSDGSDFECFAVLWDKEHVLECVMPNGHDATWNNIQRV